MRVFGNKMLAPKLKGGKAFLRAHGGVEELLGEKSRVKNAIHHYARDFFQKDRRRRAAARGVEALAGVLMEED